MCGIFAYLNHFTPHTRQQIIETLLTGLKALEHKGYDSAGIALSGQKGIQLVKKSGTLCRLQQAIQEIHGNLDLSEPLKSHSALAHTRWATHGEPSDNNAHPQSSNPQNEFVVIHNGIITNYKELSKFLMSKGISMQTDTDTEVIVKLMRHLHQVYKHDVPFHSLVEATVNYLEGAFAVVFKSSHYPEQMVLACNGSPMMIGVRSPSKFATDHISGGSAKDGRGFNSHKNTGWTLEASQPEAGIEYFVSSDASAVAGFTNKVIYLEDNDIASISHGKLTIHKINNDDDGNNSNNCNNSNIAGDYVKSREISLLQNEIYRFSKGDFSTYMEKEIYEQVDSVMNTMRGRVNFETNQVTLGGIKAHTSEIGRCKRLLIIACATSYHAAVATRQLIEELTELCVMVDLASDFLDRTTPIFRDDVCIFLSQSGETADTLQALRHCKDRGALIVGITNTVGSSVCRESHCGIHANAGPEIGVASTKAYTSQFISLVLFSLVMCHDRMSLQARRKEIIQGLKLLPEQIAEIFEQADVIRELANELKDEKSVLFIGRGYNYATCLEGALKIKELTYMHSECINAGELKHGPLALVDQQMAMLLVATKDAVYPKCINALQQITARHGKPIVICTKGDEEVKSMAYKAFEVPKQVDCLQGILTIIPMQLLSLHIAQLKNFNVDQPRSLLKHYSEGDF